MCLEKPMYDTVTLVIRKRDGTLAQGKSIDATSFRGILPAQGDRIVVRLRDAAGYEAFHVRERIHRIDSTSGPLPDGNAPLFLVVEGIELSEQESVALAIPPRPSS
jgi:hypothetical protein